ncbi:hypothetical protein D1J17_25615, partial [Escherichia coli]|nr:hypothetical protein [Escherichia coli]
PFGHFLPIKNAPPERGMFACTFFFLHGAGCLPVNSVPAPESAIIPYTYSLIAPPHRGIHHASFF